MVIYIPILEFGGIAAKKNDGVDIWKVTGYCTV
jgi:hypothetical protein